MLYGPFAPVNNVPVPLGLDQEIACIMRLIAEARARRAAVAPTAAATEKFLARLGAAFPDTVWVGGCKNWYTGQQPTPVLWPLRQIEHKAFFAEVPAVDFDFNRPGRETERAIAKDAARIDDAILIVSAAKIGRSAEMGAQGLPEAAGMPFLCKAAQAGPKAVDDYSRRDWPVLPHSRPSLRPSWTEEILGLIARLRAPLAPA